MYNDFKGKEVRWDIVCAVMAIIGVVIFLGFVFWIAWIYPYFYFNPQSLADMKPMDTKANELYYETYTLLDNPKLKWPYPWKNNLWIKAQMIHDSIHADYLNALNDEGVSVSNRTQYKEELETLEKCLTDVKTFPTHPSAYCVRGDFSYDSSLVPILCDWNGKCPNNTQSTVSNPSSPDVAGATIPALVNRRVSDDSTRSESESHPVVEESAHGFGGGAHAVADGR